MSEVWIVDVIELLQPYYYITIYTTKNKNKFDYGLALFANHKYILVMGCMYATTIAEKNHSL